MKATASNKSDTAVCHCGNELNWEDRLVELAIDRLHGYRCDCGATLYVGKQEDFEKAGYSIEGAIVFITFTSEEPT